MKSSSDWQEDKIKRVAQGNIRDDDQGDLDDIAAELLMREASTLDKKAKANGAEAYFDHIK